MSGAIIRHKPLYYDALLDVTQNWCWEGWIEFMLVIIETAAIATRTRIILIQSIILATKLLAENEGIKNI